MRMNFGVPPVDFYVWAYARTSTSGRLTIKGLTFLYLPASGEEGNGG